MSEKSMTSKLSSVEPNLKAKVGIKVAEQESVAQYKVSETFCDRIVKTFSLFCRQKAVVDSFRTQVREHLVCDDLTFFKRAKNFVCWFRAYYLRQELPDVSGYRMSGPFRRWAFPRLRCSSGRGHNRRNDHLWNSFFLMKNCCLPVTDAKVMQELHGHYTGGPVADTCKAADVSEMVQELAPLLNEVATKMAKAYSALADPDDWMDMYPASNKASMDTPQSRGGEAMELYYAAFESGSDKGAPWLEADHWGFAGPMSPLSEARKMHDSQDTWDPRMPLERRLVAEQGLMYGPREVVTPLGSRLAMGLYDMSTVAESRWFWTEEQGLTWFHCTPPHKLVESKVYNTFVYADSYIDMLHWTLNSERPVETNELFSCGDDHSWVVTRAYPESRKVFRDFLKRELEDFPESPMTKEEYDQLIGKKPGWTKGYTLEESILWEGPIARVVPVKEPLKVRVIGVGDAVMNYLGSWYQKTLHGILKEYPMFKLLGEAPVSTCVVDLWSGRAEESSDVLAMSSDFKGASNQTPKAARDGLLERCQHMLPSAIQRVNRFSNADHLLMYNWHDWNKFAKLPEGRGVAKPKMFQASRQGTQMGTKTSFPILSMEVFGSFVLACRRHGITKPLPQLYRSVLVNGDDLLALVTRGLHDEFWRTCESLQFTKSVGKSYFHESYANINSQSYTFRVVDDEVIVRKTGALFCGLLVGQKKLATDVFDPTSVITALLDSCYDAQMERNVLKMFLGIHRKALKAQACGRNLFISVGLGGCGQRKPQGWSSPVSDVQQRVASYLLSKGDLALVQPTDPVLRRVPAPVPKREVWDVRGVPTYWEQVRKLQTGDGEAVVPLSVDLWVIERDPSFNTFQGPLVKKQRLTSRVVRRVPTTPQVCAPMDGWFCPDCRTSNHILVSRCSSCGSLPSSRSFDHDDLGRCVHKMPEPRIRTQVTDLIVEAHWNNMLATGHRSRVAWDNYTEAAPVTVTVVDRVALYRMGG